MPHKPKIVRREKASCEYSLYQDLTVMISFGKRMNNVYSTLIFSGIAFLELGTVSRKAAEKEAVNTECTAKRKNQ